MCKTFNVVMIIINYSFDRYLNHKGVGCNSRYDDHVYQAHLFN